MFRLRWRGAVLALMFAVLFAWWVVPGPGDAPRRAAEVGAARDPRKGGEPALARGPGRPARPRAFDGARMQAPDEEAVGAAGRPLLVRVRWPTDQPPLGPARVAAYQGPEPLREAQTDGDGIADLGQLPEAPTRITACAEPDLRGSRWLGSSPAAAARGEAPSIEVRLAPTMRVHGQVVAAATGLPIAGALVGANQGSDLFAHGEPIGPFAPPTDSAGRYEWRVEVPAPSNATGAYWELVAWAPGFQYAAEHFSSLPTAGTDRRVDFVLDAGGTLYGRVVDPHGRPLPQASVFAAFEEQAPDQSVGFDAGNWIPGTLDWYHGILVVVTAADGSYRIPGLRLGQTYGVWARHEEWPPVLGVRGLGLDEATDARRVDLAFQAHASLEVRMTGAGRPASYARTIWVDGERLNAQGPWPPRFHSLWPGRRTVALEAQPHGAWQEVELAPGALTRVEFALDDRHVVEGRVTDLDGSGLAAVTVLLAPEAANPPKFLERSASCDAGGRFRFDGVTKGPYRVEVRRETEHAGEARLGSPRTIEVPCGPLAFAVEDRIGWSLCATRTDGRPLPDALWVWIDRDAEDWPRRVPLVDGRYRLISRPGRRTIRLAAFGLEPRVLVVDVHAQPPTEVWVALAPEPQGEPVPLRVLDEHGQPVGGARLCWAGTAPRIAFGHTDGAGVTVLSAPPRAAAGHDAARAWLVASADGFATTCQEVPVDPPSAQPVDVVLRRGVRVTVTVPAPSTPGPLPTRRVTIEATADAKGVLLAEWIGPASRPFDLRLLPGTYEVRVFRRELEPGEAMRFFEPASVTQVAVPDRPAFRLTLPP